MSTSTLQPRGVCPTVLDILRTNTAEADDGTTKPLVANISLAECEFLAGLIDADATIRRTLEVGFAYGVSSGVICWATAGREGARHCILDPCQSDYFGNIGHHTLRRAGLDHYDFLEEGSEFALPRLAASQPASFDLIFIDGWHTFDHTMLDLFYANRLLRVGGLIVVDDCGFPAVARAITYFSKYPAYAVHGEPVTDSVSWRRRLTRLAGSAIPSAIRPYVLPKRAYEAIERARYSTMIALKKTGEDDRPFNWHPAW